MPDAPKFPTIRPSLARDIRRLRAATLDYFQNKNDDEAKTELIEAAAALLPEKHIERLGEKLGIASEAVAAAKAKTR